MIKSLFQKVIVAYNGSKSSLNALMYGIVLAKIHKIQLKIVYVVDSASIKSLVLTKIMIVEEGERVRKALEEDGKKNLEYALSLAKKKGVNAEADLRSGSVWSEIISAANSFDASLILIGGHGNGKDISRQDSEIIARSQCSVMVVKDVYMEQKFKLA